jgi:DNA adenine methylase
LYLSAVQQSLPFISGEIKLSSRSPLRYPGGKTRGVEIIFSFFPKGIDEMVSPFFGGGSVELFAASKGIKVLGYDVFSPLVEFWQCLLEDGNALAGEVQKHFPLSKKDFYELQKKQTSFPGKMQRAAVYYVLNRSSFSGATLSGGMSPHHPRFTQSSIERLKNFQNRNVSVSEADFTQSLKNYPSVFTYLDPPYLIKSSLYGKKGDAHKDFNHESLAEILRSRKNWLLSYNDCEEIRKLYHGFRIIMPNWKYGMSNNKTSREVLIFSEDIKV